MQVGVNHKAGREMTNTAGAPGKQFRVLLVLGRVSNLPTVWSNCLAAWLMSGGGTAQRFLALCAGASLLYTGGMFLNDACDAGFDRKYRPERPIPSGAIHPRNVWLGAILLLSIGWCALALLGWAAATFASLLLANIVVYNVVHKHVSAGPWLMCGCRFLLYITAGAAALGGVSLIVVWFGLALSSYVLGLSYLARGEYSHASRKAVPIAALFTPVAVALGLTKNAFTLLPILALILWVFWCVSKARVWRALSTGRGIGGLLAGIVLVDWLAAAAQGQPWTLVFIGLFAFALVLQSTIPAS